MTGKTKMWVYMYIMDTWFTKERGKRKGKERGSFLYVLYTDARFKDPLLFTYFKTFYGARYCTHLYYHFVIDTGSCQTVYTFIPDVYQAFLAELQSSDTRVFSLNLQRSAFLKVQFLHPDVNISSGSNTSRDSHMLVFLHKECRFIHLTTCCSLFTFTLIFISFEIYFYCCCFYLIIVIFFLHYPAFYHYSFSLITMSFFCLPFWTQEFTSCCDIKKKCNSWFKHWLIRLLI